MGVTAIIYEKLSWCLHERNSEVHSESQTNVKFRPKARTVLSRPFAGIAGLSLARGMRVCKSTQCAQEELFGYLDYFNAR